MPRICYTRKEFNETHRMIIDHANAILEQYRQGGYPDITLRQLYYQFVSRDLFPASWANETTGSTNNVQSYKKLGTIMSDARRAGLIDWDRLSDITRNVVMPRHWAGPHELVEACARQFDVDWWVGQQYRPEVWIEKDALVGVLEVACGPWHCPYFSCRGYTSDSELWTAARRMMGTKQRGQTPFVIHLGDHDPSGIDMTRDISDRLRLFSGFKITVKRIALNMDQVEQYNPPPNPAKSTDSRYKGYEDEFGDQSWELDALRPEVITDLVRDAMLDIVDDGLFREREAERDEGRRRLQALADDWDNLTGDL